MNSTPEEDIGMELLYGSSEYSLEQLPENDPIELSEGVRRVYLNLLARAEDEIAFDVATLLCAAGEEAGIRHFIKFARASRPPGAEPISPHRLTEEEMAYDDCSSAAIRFVDAGGDVGLAHELLRSLLQRFPATNFTMNLPSLLESYDLAEGVKDDIRSAVLRAQAAHRPSEVANMVGALGRFYPEEALRITRWLLKELDRGAPLTQTEVGRRLAMVRTQQGRLLSEELSKHPDLSKVGEIALSELYREFELEEGEWEGVPVINDRWSNHSWLHPSVPKPLAELLNRGAQGDGPRLLKGLEQLLTMEAKDELWAQHPFMPHDRAYGFMAEAAFLHQRQSKDPQIYLEVCRTLLKSAGPRRCSAQLKCALLDGPSESIVDLIETRFVQGLDADQKDNVAPLYPVLAKHRPARAWALLDRLRDPEDRPLNPEAQLTQGLAVMGGARAIAQLRTMVSHENASVVAGAETALEYLGEAPEKTPEATS